MYSNIRKIRRHQIIYKYKKQMIFKYEQNDQKAELLIQISLNFTSIHNNKSKASFSDRISVQYSIYKKLYFFQLISLINTGTQNSTNELCIVS